MQKNYQHGAVLFQIGLFLIFFSSSAFAEVCYKSELLGKFDEVSCAIVPVKVTKTDCNTNKVLSEARRNGRPNCSKKNPILRIRFEGQSLIVKLKGAKAWGGTEYTVISTQLDVKEKAPEAIISEVKTSDEVKVTEVKTTDVKTSELKTPEATLAKEPEPDVSDAPISFKVAGFAHIEFESTSNFGYDGTDTGQGNIPNFDSSQANSKQAVSSLLSNVQFDISKDKTTLTTNFEVGEILNGEANSGGSVGGRARILEVRNFFLTQNFDENWTLSAGLQPLQSDPNAYVVSDHYSSASLSYQNDSFNGSLWTAKSEDNKPGLSPATATPDEPFVQPDVYSGFWLQNQFSESLKAHLYGVQRRTNESLYDEVGGVPDQGASTYNWLGVTVENKFSDEVSLSVSAITNQGNWKSDSSGLSDTYTAALVNAKLDYSLKNWSFAIEGLSTTGASDQVSSLGGGLSSIGKRKSFAANGVPYLLTIATNDGVDEAPGVPKESIIGGINQAEGVQIMVLKACTILNDKWSGFIRYGVVNAAQKSSTTDSSAMGTEIDIQASYQLSKSALLQIDGAIFTPGSFYLKKDAAQFLGLRWKFSF